MAMARGSSSEAVREDAALQASNQASKKRASKSDQRARKKAHTPATILRRMINKSLEEPCMEAFKDGCVIDATDLNDVPPAVLLRKYLAWKNNQYSSNHVESVAMLLQTFMEVHTEHYDSMGTLKEFIRTASKKSVVAFLRDDVLGTHTCRQVNDKYVDACYKAIYAFATLLS